MFPCGEKAPAEREHRVALGNLRVQSGRVYLVEIFIEIGSRIPEERFLSAAETLFWTVHMHGGTGRRAGLKNQDWRVEN